MNLSFMMYSERQTTPSGFPECQASLSLIIISKSLLHNCHFSGSEECFQTIVKGLASYWHYLLFIFIYYYTYIIISHYILLSTLICYEIIFCMSYSKTELLEECQVHAEYESCFLSVDSANLVILQLQLEFICKTAIPYMEWLHILNRNLPANICYC